MAILFAIFAFLMGKLIFLFILPILYFCALLSISLHIYFNLGFFSLENGKLFIAVITSLKLKGR